MYTVPDSPLSPISALRQEERSSTTQAETVVVHSLDTVCCSVLDVSGRKQRVSVESVNDRAEDIATSFSGKDPRTRELLDSSLSDFGIVTDCLLIVEIID